MKNKIYITIILLQFMILISLFWNIYVWGDRDIREQMIADTVWALAEEGYTKDDVEFIGGDHAYGLTSPQSQIARYHGMVSIASEEQMRDYFYAWDDAEMKDIYWEYGGDKERYLNTLNSRIYDKIFKRMKM